MCRLASSTVNRHRLPPKMKSLERARRVLEDTRKGSTIYDLSRPRVEVLIAEALREARAHGANLVIRALETIASPDESAMQKLKSVVLDMLAMDEQISSEPIRPTAPAMSDVYVIDADKSPDPAAVDALASLMSDISQEHYCAGWMNDLEQRLWGMLQGKDRQYGNGVVSDANIAQLRSLHEKCGGWIVWQGRDAGHEPSGMKFVTTAEWAQAGR